MREKATTRTMDGGREGSTINARGCAETGDGLKTAQLAESVLRRRDGDGASRVDDDDETRV